MQEHNVKLIKWGIIFFGSPASLKFGPSLIEIQRKDGGVVLSCAPSELSRANYNNMNGMITLKSSTGQKCNIAFIQDDTAAQKFGEFLDSIKVKGFNI